MKFLVSAACAVLFLFQNVYSGEIIQKQSWENYSDLLTPWNYRIITGDQNYKIIYDVAADESSVSYKICNTVTNNCERLGPHESVSSQEMIAAFSETNRALMTSLGAGAGYLTAAITGFVVCASIVKGSSALGCFLFIVPIAPQFAAIDGAAATLGGYLAYKATDPAKKAEMRAMQSDQTIEVGNVVKAAERIHRDLYKMLEGEEDVELDLP